MRARSPPVTPVPSIQGRSIGHRREQDVLPSWHSSTIGVSWPLATHTVVDRSSIRYSIARLRARPMSRVSAPSSLRSVVGRGCTERVSITVIRAIRGPLVTNSRTRGPRVQASSSGEPSWVVDRPLSIARSPQPTLGPINTAKSTVPTPTVPPSSHPRMSTVTSIPKRTRDTGQP